MSAAEPTPAPWEWQDDGTLVGPDDVVVLKAPDLDVEGHDARLVRLAPQLVDWIARALTTGRLDPAELEGGAVDVDGEYYGRTGRELVAEARGDGGDVS